MLFLAKVFCLVNRARGTALVSPGEARNLHGENNIEQNSEICCETVPFRVQRCFLKKCLVAITVTSRVIKRFVQNRP